MLLVLLFLAPVSLGTVGADATPVPPAQSASPGLTAARMLELRDLLRQRIAELEKGLAKPGATPASRELGYAALFLLMDSAEPDAATRAAGLLERAFAVQIMDERHAEYGRIDWTVGKQEIRDLNAVEFNALSWSVLLSRHAGRFTEEFRARFLKHARALVAALLRHQVPHTYTNIYLMKAVSLVMLGSVCALPDAVKQGKEMLEKMRLMVRDFGATEYGSPVYAAVDLHCLYAFLFAASPEYAPLAAELLANFWKDLANRYYPATQSLAGPASRDYDFLARTGGIDWYTWLVGWRNLPVEHRPDPERVFCLLLELPSAETSAVALQMQKNASGQWHPDDPAKTWWLRMTGGWALGWAAGDYGPQDRTFTIHLPSLTGKPPYPVLALRPVAGSDAFGFSRSPDRSGHLKPTHLPAGVAAVLKEDSGAMEVMLSSTINPKAAGRLTALDSVLVLPAGVAIQRRDNTGQPWQELTFPPANWSMREEAVLDLSSRTELRLSIPIGDGARGVTLTISPVVLGEAGGRSAQLALVASPQGYKNGAFGLRIRHFSSWLAVRLDESAITSTLKLVLAEQTR